MNSTQYIWKVSGLNTHQWLPRLRCLVVLIFPALFLALPAPCSPACYSWTSLYLTAVDTALLNNLSNKWHKWRDWKMLIISSKVVLGIIAEIRSEMKNCRGSFQYKNVWKIDILMVALPFLLHDTDYISVRSLTCILLLLDTLVKTR